MDDIPVNRVTRAFCVGSKLADSCTICGYRFVKCKSSNNHISLQECGSVWKCPLHGKHCIGHLETDSSASYTLAPCTITPNSRDIKNKYQRCKEMLVSQAMTETKYKTLLSKIMMGKKGTIRNMNFVRVEGSLKMVISVGESCSNPIVTIPRSVANNIKVPYVDQGKVLYRGVCDSDYAMLVRQPCLWSGGIQPVTLQVTEPMLVTEGTHTWDVNQTMRIPNEMCSPYAADFDGDEMSLFPLLSQKSIDECKLFKWGYKDMSNASLRRSVKPNNSHMFGSEFNDMCIRTTVCWSDSKTRGFKVTEAHKVCQLSVSSFIKFLEVSASPSDFATKALLSMNISASKSSLQSDIEALSRRSKLGAEKIFIFTCGCLRQFHFFSIIHF